MPAEASPAFQFYVRDWLGDARVRAMTHEARGVYMDLLCYCWQEITLTNDLPSLARMSGMTIAAFRRVWPQIAPCFTPDGAGFRHRRLDDEREKQAAFSAQQSVRGKKGARVKWQRERERRDDGHGHTPAIDTAIAQVASGHESGHQPGYWPDDGSASAITSASTPPIPPSSEGGCRPLTRKERVEAEKVLESWAHWCRHDPRCEGEGRRERCLARIAVERRQLRERALKDAISEAVS